MGKTIDLTGQRFGRLVVVSRATSQRKDRNTFWTCICDCGKEKIIEAPSLKKGRSKSCGCLQKEIVTKRQTKHGLQKANNRLYGIWSGIKQRCTNPKRNVFRHYGGKGIVICQEWQKFPAFYSWAISNGYADNLTIDRIDNNGNYEPSNCRWIPDSAQHRNQTNNKFITVNGKAMLLCDWAKIYGIKASVILNRIRSGWTEEEAVITPLQKSKARYRAN